MSTDIFGFSEPVANQIIDNLAPDAVGETGRPLRFGIRWGRTTAAVAANSIVTVTVQRPNSTGWEDHFTISAWNRGPAIAAGQLLRLEEIDQRICITWMCEPAATSSYAVSNPPA